MPTEILKVTKKQRAIDDVDDGIVYKTTMVEKSGKKGEHAYRKVQLVIEEGTPTQYDIYEPEELIKVAIDPAHKKLTEFPNQDEDEPP